MAKNEVNRKVPTPAELDKRAREGSEGRLGFGDVLKYLSLGMTPSAPRLPEQAYGGSSYYGGYQKGYAGTNSARGTVSFTLLRQIAERSSLLAAIVSKRQFQCTRFAKVARKSTHGEVGFRVMHRRHGEEGFTVPDGYKNLCREAEEMMLSPWNVYWNEGVVFQDIEPNLDDFMAKIMEDHLVINRPVIELGLDMYGTPRAFGAIDGANVIPTFSAIKYLTTKARLSTDTSWQENYTGMKAIMQQLSDHYQIDITDETEYIYLMGGKPVRTFPTGRLIVAPFLPSTDVRFAGYPRSLTEKAIFCILAEIMAMSANLKYFQTGNMTEVLLAMKGSYDDKHVVDLTNILQANMSGIDGMFKVPLLALPDAQDLAVHQLRQNHKDMLFDFYVQKLTNLACAVFSMHPSEINEAPRAGDNKGALQGANQETQISMAQEQGLETSLNHFKTHIFDPILRRIDPDLTMEWDYGKSEKEVIDLAVSKATFITVNEQRKMCGMEEIDDEAGGNIIANPFIQAANQQKQLQEQQQQQMQQQGQQQQQQGGQAGAGGQENEFGKPPF
jgi:hypothetical protein